MESRWVETLVAVYRAALRLLPWRLRQAHAAEMTAVFERLVQDARTRSGRASAVIRAARELGDVLLTAIRVRGRTLRFARPRRDAFAAVVVSPPGGKRMQGLVQDVRSGLRSLARRPAFSAGAILVLALGIGASVSLFSVLDAVILRPLPYRDAATLYAVWQRPPRNAQWPRQTVPFQVFLDWRRHASSFTTLAGFMGRDFTLLTAAGPERVRGDVTSPELFTLLGLRTAYGRILDVGDAAGPPAVVLSHRFWQERFGGDPEAVGRGLQLDGITHTVIGVLVPDAILPVIHEQPAFWIALTDAGSEFRDAPDRVKVVGRLGPGASVSSAEAELASIQQAYEEREAVDWRARGVFVQPLQHDRAFLIRPTLHVLAAGVGVLLLIACVNVAGLLLGRGAERARDVAVRASLGASRLRLVQQLIAETLVLWMLGGVLGIGLAILGTAAFVRANPFGVDELPSPETIAVDARVVLFATGLTLVTALAFGAFTALQGSRHDLNDALRQSGRGTSAARATQRRRSILVTVEVALSVALLVVAGVLVVSFARLSTQPLGFQPAGLHTFKLTLPEDRYADDGERLRFHTELMSRLRAVPGVDAASVTSARPLGNIIAASFSIEGRAPEQHGEAIWSAQQAVDPESFQVAGMRLLRGRAFDANDDERGEPVVIINETLARRFFPNEDPIGKRIRHAEEDQPWMRIVGDVKHGGLELDMFAETFVPYRQVSGSYAVMALDVVVMLRMRPESPPEFRALQEAVWSVDRTLPLTEVLTGEQLVGESAAHPRFRTGLIAAYALMALLLASVGLYAVLSQTVAQRQREIGIRVALGATPRGILGLVIGDGLRLAALGAAVGVIGALASARLLESLLLGVQARNPVIVIGVVALTLVVAALASSLPARRATRIDPMTALHHE